jgi:hypothetical protein
MSQITQAFQSRSAARAVLLIAVLAGTAGLYHLLAQGRGIVRLPNAPTGSVVAQATGRLVGGGGLNGDYEMICYFTFIEGFGTSVFAGEPGERNAMFTLRTDGFKFQTFLNGALVHFGRLVTPGTEAPAIRVYYSATPNRDFARPETYSQGQLVAVLRTRGVQGNLSPSLHFRAVGSMTLETSSNFTVNGRTINLGPLGDAVTSTMSGVAPSAAEFASASTLSHPLSATMVSAVRIRD